MNQMSPLARTESLIIKELADETLIYDTQRDKAHCLNSTAALVWKNCDGKRSVNDLRELIEKDAGVGVPEEMVWLALDQLKKQNLIEEEKEIPSSFKGLSRREVIRRIGIGSMVALPIITAMIAPLPAYAASGCVPVLPGCACMAGTMTGVDCTGTEAVPCASPLCRCESTGGATGMILDNCVP